MLKNGRTVETWWWREHMGWWACILSKHVLVISYITCIKSLELMIPTYGSSWLRWFHTRKFIPVFHFHILSKLRDEAGVCQQMVFPWMCTVDSFKDDHLGFLFTQRKCLWWVSKSNSKDRPRFQILGPHTILQQREQVGRNNWFSGWPTKIQDASK